MGRAATIRHAKTQNIQAWSEAPQLLEALLPMLRTTLRSGAFSPVAVTRWNDSVHRSALGSRFLFQMITTARHLRKLCRCPLFPVVQQKTNAERGDDAFPAKY